MRTMTIATGMKMGLHFLTALALILMSPKLLGLTGHNSICHPVMFRWQWAIFLKILLKEVLNIAASRIICGLLSFLVYDLSFFQIL